MQSKLVFFAGHAITKALFGDGLAGDSSGMPSPVALCTVIVVVGFVVVDFDERVDVEVLVVDVVVFTVVLVGVEVDVESVVVVVDLLVLLGIEVDVEVLVVDDNLVEVTVVEVVVVDVVVVVVEFESCDCTSAKA
jgi:hypothetical protein